MRAAGPEQKKQCFVKLGTHFDKCTVQMLLAYKKTNKNANLQNKRYQLHIIYSTKINLNKLSRFNAVMIFQNNGGFETPTYCCLLLFIL